MFQDKPSLDEYNALVKIDIKSFLKMYKIMPLRLLKSYIRAVYLGFYRKYNLEVEEAEKLAERDALKVTEKLFQHNAISVDPNNLDFIIVNSAYNSEKGNIYWTLMDSLAMMFQIYIREMFNLIEDCRFCKPPIQSPFEHLLIYRNKKAYSVTAMPYEQSIRKISVDDKKVQDTALKILFTEDYIRGKNSNPFYDPRFNYRLDGMEDIFIFDRIESFEAFSKLVAEEDPDFDFTYFQRAAVFDWDSYKDASDNFIIPVFHMYDSLLIDF